MPAVVCFGELMLRLSPPGLERFLQSPAFVATFGGAEANVAVSLAQFGLESRYVTRLPANAIGDAALGALRAHGVRVDAVERGGDRIGIYFLETGASQRPSVVIYDRAHSAITDLDPSSLDWSKIFEGVSWFHTSGITPALGEKPAACTVSALRIAKERGLRVSVDLNFRKKLWSEAEAQRVMRPLMNLVDLVIANEEDLQSVLGIEVPSVDVRSGKVDPEAYCKVAESVSREFGPRWVAITLRESTSASHNGWRAALFDGASGQYSVSRRYELTLVDRVGAGDSFAAGLIHGLLSAKENAKALEFAVAASALKQSIPGDFNRVSVAEVERLAEGDGSGRVQR